MSDETVSIEAEALAATNSGLAKRVLELLGSEEQFDLYAEDTGPWSAQVPRSPTPSAALTSLRSPRRCDRPNPSPPLTISARSSR